MGCIKYLQAKEVQDVYKHIRNTMDDDNGQFRHIFEQAERMARHIGEEPSKPRTTSRQQHRNNAGGTEGQSIYVLQKQSGNTVSPSSW